MSAHPPEDFAGATPSEPLPDPAGTVTDASASADVGKSLPTSRQGRSGLMILWAVVLVLAAALVWMWQDSKKRDLEWQTHIAQRLGVLENAHSGHAAREKQYENRLQLIQEKTAALEWRVNEWQTNRQALEKLYRQLLPLRDDVTMREVEHRVRFAVQQLAMSGNVRAALAALQDADAELMALNRPDLSVVKVALTRSIEALQRMPTFDMHDFLIRFDQALNTVDQMTPKEIPVAMPKAKIAVDDAASWWQRGWAETKGIMLSMVRLHVVEKADGDVGASRSHLTAHLTDPVLDRQELRLRLLSLRWLALSRQPMVSAEAAAVRDGLMQRFSESDPAVQTLYSLLEELASSSVAVPLPEIAPVLEALRLWRAEQATAGTDSNNGDGL